MKADRSPQTLHKDSAALVIVDMQPSLFPLCVDKDAVLRNVITLIRAAKIFRMPMLITEQYPKGLGRTIPEIQKELPDARPIEKTEFSCMRNDRFIDALKAHSHVGTLIVVGIEAHICVSQTALDALANAYPVHAVADAVSSRTEENRRIGLERMRSAGAEITSTEAALYELLENKDAKEFKEILALVKG